MAELIIAVVIFTAAVVGLGGVLIFGGSLVQSSSMDNTATNLAAAELQSVKALPFYKAWDGAPQDVDDYYYDYTKDNPGQISNGPISRTIDPITFTDSDGHKTCRNVYEPKQGYKRTTAVQYVYVKTTDGLSSLAAAEMNPNWRPRNPDTAHDQFDIPEGGPPGGALYQTLQAELVETKIAYTDGGIYKVLTQRELVGLKGSPGLMTNPVLTVNSIKVTAVDFSDDNGLPRTSPAYGYLGETVTAQIEVDTNGQLASGDTVEVQLWRSGQEDTLNGTGVQINGETITCNFSFQNPLPETGLYNLSVNWKNRGFKDDSYRNSFQIRPQPPVINSVKTAGNEPAWGYKGQNSRTLYLTGSNLWGLKKVRLARTDGTQCAETTDITLTPAGAPDGMHAEANINLASVSYSEQLNVIAIDGDGYASDPTTDGGYEAFNSNPGARIDSIDLDTPNSYNWGYRALSARPVKIHGQYLYGLYSATAGERTTLTLSGKTPCKGTISTQERDRTCTNTITSDDVKYVTATYDLTGDGTSRPNGSSWGVWV